MLKSQENWQELFYECGSMDSVMSSFVRLLNQKDEEGLSEEQVRVAMEAAKAKIEKARKFKALAIQAESPRLLAAAEEEIEMYERLLAEFQLLSGEK